MNFQKLKNLMGITMKITVFFRCDTVQFGKCYRKLVNILTKTWVNIHHTTWHYISQNSNIQVWETRK
jgi:hypothetical protein